MTPPTIDINVFRSLRGAADFAKCDHPQSAADAWIYGILVGWGER